MKSLLLGNQQLSGADEKYNFFYDPKALYSAVVIASDNSTDAAKEAAATLVKVEAAPALNTSTSTSGGRRRTRVHKKVGKHRTRTHKR